MEQINDDLKAEQVLETVHADQEVASTLLDEPTTSRTERNANDAPQKAGDATDPATPNDEVEQSAQQPTVEQSPLLDGEIGAVRTTVIDTDPFAPEINAFSVLRRTPGDADTGLFTEQDTVSSGLSNLRMRRERDNDRADEPRTAENSNSGDPGSAPESTGGSSASGNPPPAPPPPPPPSDDQPLNIVGTNANETLTGAGGDDTIDGGSGDDVLRGMGGDDDLLGNFGNDTAFGGDGNDYIFGSFGNDTLYGETGNDDLRGGFNHDRLYGGSGDDYLSGWSGNDILNGGIGSDTMDGGIDHDTYIIDGTAPGDVDVVIDQSGNDILVFDGFDPLTGIGSVQQVGNDLIFSYADGGSLTLTDFYGAGAIETLRVGGVDYLPNADATNPLSFEDFLNGTDDEILSGTAGNDNLVGGIGNDQISGFGGADVLSGAGGNDQINGGDGNDELHGGDGDDTLNGAGGGSSDFSGADTLYGDAGEDTLYGGGGNDWLYGGADNDRLLGEFGDDRLFGDGGDDYLFGDFGKDILNGGDGNDEIRGGYHNDTLNGDAGDDFLHGFSGNDWLSGGTGNDRMEGGDGNDRFIVKRGTGNDIISDFTAFSAGALYVDTIDLSDFGMTAFSDLAIGENNGNAVIDLGNGDTLTLEGVGAGDLSETDFSF